MRRKQTEPFRHATTFPEDIWPRCRGCRPGAGCVFGRASSMARQSHAAMTGSRCSIASGIGATMPACSSMRSTSSS